MVSAARQGAILEVEGRAEVTAPRLVERVRELQTIPQIHLRKVAAIPVMVAVGDRAEVISGGSEVRTIAPNQTTT